MSEQATIRKLLLCITARHREETYFPSPPDGMDIDETLPLVGKGYCESCGRTWPCGDSSDAVAALALMDEAEVALYPPTRYRLIPDPGAGPSLPGAPTNEETT